MIKRLADIVCAVLLLVLTAPVFLLVLVITWWQLRCWVIYSEPRVGKDGKPFIMHKVVTMIQTPENLEARKLGPIKKNDPRLTKFGRFIRRYSLDELPQLFNVIKGDMSLIGPRPAGFEVVERWRDVLPNYMRRFSVLPGMSGWAQVNGYRKGYIEPENRLEHDLYYIDNWSLFFDIIIALKTPKAILVTDVW